MNNPWLQHILLLAAIHTVCLGVSKFSDVVGEASDLQYLRTAGSWGEAGSYLANGLLMVAITVAWIGNRADVAGVSFGDMVLPTTVIPGVLFLMGLFIGPDSPVNRLRNHDQRRHSDRNDSW